MEWFEELDFDENPFTDTEHTELIGYDDTLDEIMYGISAGHIMFIEGNSGQGKTALLKRAIARFKGGGNVVYLNCKKLENGLNIEHTLNKKNGFFGRLFNKPPKGMILLVDEIHDLSKRNSERLKYYYDQNFVSSVVFTGEDIKKVDFTRSMLDRVSKVIRLKEISGDDAVDILHTRLENHEIIPDDIAKDVFRISQGNPKLFLQNCEALCKLAIERKNKLVTEDMVDELFGDKQKKQAKKAKDRPAEAKQQKKTHQKKAKPEATVIDKGLEEPEDIAEKYY